MAENLAILEYFSNWIYLETGITYKSDIFFQLESRLQEIARYKGFETLDALFQFAQSGEISGDFKQMLINVATNNETSFFRDGKLFKALTEAMLPEIINREPKAHSIKIWSAASSFGQEACTIAMSLLELEREGKTLLPWDILATDLSMRALTRVQKGVYTQLEVQRGLSASLLIRYFDKIGDDQWQAKESIRTKVRTAQLNLLHQESIVDYFDIIFCRNVLIYQTEQKKKEILSALVTHLKPGGFFALGAAESLLGLSDSFDQLYHGGAVYYKKK